MTDLKQPYPKTVSPTKNSNLAPIRTLGKVFSDGAVIEPIRDFPKKRLLLLVCAADRRTVARQIEFRGQSYRPIAIDSTILSATIFPTKFANFGSTTKLFEAARAVFARYGFPEEIARLVPYIVFATWFTDVLPAAPCLVISGPRPEAELLLQLLRCLVRHPFPLAQVSRSTFCSVPMTLQPTLLINQPRIKSSAWELLDASNHHGAHILQSGTVVDLFCAKAIYCGEVAIDDICGGGTLRINLTPSRGRLPLLDATEHQEIASEFQEKMLAYRCKNILKVKQSTCDFPEFDSSIRILARVLGAPIVEAPELQADLEPFLRNGQEEAQSARAFDLRCVSLEALLFHCHKAQKKRVLVGEITKTVNAILKGRGEKIKWEPEEVGRVLRKHGFSKNRTARGFALRLDQGVCRCAHDLAHRFQVATVQDGIGTCPLCKQVEVIGKNGKCGNKDSTK
jgi:hypothetical protein